jgi:transketolase
MIAEIERSAEVVGKLQIRARNIRRHVLHMAERVGQGYVGQGLGIADLLATLYFDSMRFNPAQLDWPARDRFVLSIGHYSIALYAALAEAGVLSQEELSTYGADGSRLEMSGSEWTPGFEITGGSLGHGLSQSIGMALGVRRMSQCGTLWPDRRAPRIYNLLSDGELQEGSTWEAAMCAAHYKLSDLYAFIDCNNQQADGPPSRVMTIEPIHEKWTAFGWHVQRVDGNDIAALHAAINSCGNVADKPHAIVLDTRMGCGVPLFERREKNHFIRVEANEWALAREQLEGGMR